jgi:hypothetical protein
MNTVKNGAARLIAKFHVPRKIINLRKLYPLRSNLTGWDGGVSSPSVDVGVSERGDD